MSLCMGFVSLTVLQNSWELSWVVVATVPLVQKPVDHSKNIVCAILSTTSCRCYALGPMTLISTWQLLEDVTNVKMEEQLQWTYQGLVQCNGHTGCDAATGHSAGRTSEQHLWDASECSCMLPFPSCVLWQKAALCHCREDLLQVDLYFRLICGPLKSNMKIPWGRVKMGAFMLFWLTSLAEDPGTRISISVLLLAPPNPLPKHKGAFCCVTFRSTTPPKAEIFSLTSCCPSELLCRLMGSIPHGQPPQHYWACYPVLVLVWIWTEHCYPQSFKKQGLPLRMLCVVSCLSCPF